jgi:hypothetical protein
MKYFKGDIMSIFERPEVSNLVDGGKCWEGGHAGL